MTEAFNSYLQWCWRFTPSAFCSNIAFKFQKNGLAHNWQVSDSTQSGAAFLMQLICWRWIYLVDCKEWQAILPSKVRSHCLHQRLSILVYSLSNLARTPCSDDLAARTLFLVDRQDPKRWPSCQHCHWTTTEVHPTKTVIEHSLCVP